MMSLSLPLLLTAAVVGCLADGKVLRPCFERYPNHRLVNVQPYHSEWRMKTEDSCLLFCAQSSTRCRSIVFDSVQHICHYFLDEGVDQAVIAAKMVYLRVAGKECLDEKVDLAASAVEIPPAAPPTLLLPQILETNQLEPTTEEPEFEVPLAEEPTTEATVVDVAPVTEIQEPSSAPEAPKPVVEEPEPVAPAPAPAPTSAPALPEDGISDAELDKQLGQVMQPTQFAGSFGEEEKIANNGVYRDIKGPNENRWQSSVEKVDETKKVTMLSNEEINEKMTRKLEKLKINDPERYAKLMGDDEDLIPAEAMKNQKEEEVEPISKRRMMNAGAKVIQFNENQMDIRRKPASARPQLKMVTISSTSYIQKAKSFADSLKENEDIEESSLQAPRQQVTTECRRDDVPVYVSFENSESAQEEAVDSSQAKSKNQCQRMCEQTNCRSFTFFEKHSQCMLNMQSDGVTLRTSSAGDFSASVTTKFCYPRSFSMFNGCSNFVAFRDYSLEVSAREEFEDLPHGDDAYKGMQLCIELCVLSDKYSCKSATFNPTNGVCRLLADDSMSMPDNFKFFENQDVLYFENGCNSGEAIDLNDRSIERVERKEKREKKLKPAKERPLRRLIVQKIR
ncbi:unnamed protein product [Caenorhabditis auriculariae]|uniref:Apple domain-containing protein n=1 Tax=Caenorhabditis auriculariae TaxID=2777116 RepID=A0A8S1HNA9_9PELO|nr:unnamed protein product [Caenorhabditis auriculariae]